MADSRDLALHSHAVVVPAADTATGEARARAFAAAGAALLLEGNDPLRLGEFAATLAEAGTRVAVVIGPCEPEVVVEMVAELFARID